MPAYGMTRNRKACGVLQKAADREDKDVDATSKFLDYVDTLGRGEVSEVSRLCIFREWMTRHRVPYPEKYLNIWIMYDVYDLKADGLSAAEAGKGAGG